MPSGRDEIEARIGSLVREWLDSAPETYGDTVKIGVVAVIYEVEFPPEEGEEYAATDIGWHCSDSRRWVQAGLFRRALVESEADVYAPEPDAT